MQNSNLRHIYLRRFLIFFKSKKVSNLSEKFYENAPKKVISKTSLTNMSKSGKSAYFRHIFAANVLLVNFFKNFSNGFEISVKFCVFWYFQTKKFFGHISTFFKLMYSKYLYVVKIPLAWVSSRKNSKTSSCSWT